jgi:hypothetical protein
MADTPHGTMATVAVHEALIQQLIDGQRDVLQELRRIVSAMTHGDARFDAIEMAQQACNARHDSEDNRNLREIPQQVAVLAEQMATMRLVVYGAVGVALAGLLGTLGVVMLKVLGQTP